MSPRRVEVHVGELVLHGFPAGDGPAIAEAVRAELGRLVTEGGIDGLGRVGPDAARLDGGTVRIPAGGGPGEVGGAVARSVYSVGR